jgi:hypothetical protein
MLYRPVYGPELKEIYEYVAAADVQGQDRPAIYAAFVPERTGPASAPTQNVDDALAFLVSAHLVSDEDGVFRAQSHALEDTAFRIQALINLRQVQTGKLSPRHVADPTYMLLLEELYAKPRQLIVRQLPVRANRLAPIQAVGGLNREKLQGWRRVMCYLGLGIPMQGEFVFAPDIELMMALIQLSRVHEGSLQALIEEHLTRYLPCNDQSGELTLAIEQCLVALVKAGRLRLYEQQDAPSRPYTAARYRGYRVEA